MRPVEVWPSSPAWGRACPGGSKAVATCTRIRRNPLNPTQDSGGLLRQGRMSANDPVDGITPKGWRWRVPYSISTLSRCSRGSSRPRLGCREVGGMGTDSSEVLLHTDCRRCIAHRFIELPCNLVVPENIEPQFRGAS